MAGHEFYIYILFRETGVPFYVGKGTKKRWLRHWWDNPRDRNKHKIAIVRNMLAAGLDVPKILLHEGLTEATAFAYEKALIAAIGRADLGLGPLTNMSDGGEGSAGLSAESLERIGAAQRGKKLSPEHAAKLKASNVGRKRTAEESAKITARNLGNKYSLGRKMSADTIAKLSAAKLGRKFSPEARANMSAARRGVKLSNEHRAALSVAQRLRWQALKKVDGQQRIPGL